LLNLLESFSLLPNEATVASFQIPPGSVSYLLHVTSQTSKQTKMFGYLVTECLVARYDDLVVNDDYTAAENV